MGFGSLQRKVYQEAEVNFMEQVATQVAVAADNAVNFEQAQSVQQQLEGQHDRFKLLLDVNNSVVSALDLRELLTAVSASLRRLVPHEFASLSLYDAETHSLHVHALDFPVSKGLLQEGLSVPLEGSPPERALTTRKPVFVNRYNIEQYSSDIARRVLNEGLKSVLCLPLISHGRPLGTLCVGSLKEENFPRRDAELLQHVANQIAIAVENALAFGRVVDRANRVTEEKLYLQDEIRAEHNFEEIVGESLALKRILEQLKTVAPTDSTILILGETGTGKELIARAIHNLSARRENTLVKVNCAAIPTGLLESELFGHEKGAFTGAIRQRIGRFELAHRGTIFLDEVGDIPLELQPKLLRVIQEQEFERLGSAKTNRVDVRMIAATNVDLARKVADNQFRLDLYYRLNVFPVTIPPLRERREDIPLLVRYFAQKYARRMKKAIDTIPAKAMRALMDYPWSGNVRELENLIERAVILSRESELEIPLSELKQQTAVLGQGPRLTPQDLPTKGASMIPNVLPDKFSYYGAVDDYRRELIARTLAQTEGNRAAAAKILGLQRP
jgi:formate hydrogenlyase transcriptional activator